MLGLPPGIRFAAVARETMVGRTLAGYTLESEVGEGGTSAVFRAKHPDHGQVAVKVLREKLRNDRTAVQRFLREARYGERVVHPNVVRTIEIGEASPGMHFLAIEWAIGELLEKYARRNGPLPPAQVADIVAQIADAVHAAHEVKIVHRDLKPENVMICRGPDSVEYAVVMDFGLAKERKAEGELQKLTATGIILGTPEFMSPEQLRGKPLDPRTDVYSLALMTYEMLTGKLPFQGRTQQEMMIARLRSDPIPIRRMRPDFDIPESVERVLDKAMSRGADDRHQTVVEFADALEQAAGGESEESGLLGKLFGR